MLQLYCSFYNVHIFTLLYNIKTIDTIATAATLTLYFPLHNLSPQQALASSILLALLAGSSEWLTLMRTNWRIHCDWGQPKAQGLILFKPWRQDSPATRLPWSRLVVADDRSGCNRSSWRCMADVLNGSFTNENGTLFIIVVGDDRDPPSSPGDLRGLHACLVLSFTRRGGEGDDSNDPWHDRQNPAPACKAQRPSVAAFFRVPWPWTAKTLEQTG